jgi:homoserine O-acetyltransferase
MRDMVRAQRLLTRSLGIERLHAVIGGSMGGMQGLVWAADFPGGTRNVVALACASRQNAQAIAFNEIGRSAIMSDPAWRGGHYEPGAGPKTGLALARMLGHVTYLSAAGIERRFGRQRQPHGGLRLATVSPVRGPYGVEFAVESYLNYQGAAFVERFDANAYLAITRAADRFDLAAGKLLAEVFANVTARVSLIGFSSDWLYPATANRATLDALRLAGKCATEREIQSDAGHDAFLLPAPALFDAIREGLA